MFNTFKTLAKSLIAVVLLVNASGVRSQTPSREKLYTSSRDKQRLARFEKQADELRTFLKIPALKAATPSQVEGSWEKVACPFDSRKALLPVTCGRLKVPEN